MDTKAEWQWQGLRPLPERGKGGLIPARECPYPSWRESASQHFIMLPEYTQASSSPFITVLESPCFDAVALTAFFPPLPDSAIWKVEQWVISFCVIRVNRRDSPGCSLPVWVSKRAGRGFLMKGWLVEAYLRTEVS